jgi:hypothetical protein
MTSVSFGQALLTIIESDIASTGGQPLITLLTALQAAKGNILMQQGAILQLLPRRLRSASRSKSRSSSNSSAWLLPRSKNSSRPRLRQQ